MTENPYQPKLGNLRVPDFPPQFDGVIDPLSVAITPVEYLDADGALIRDLHATGFFYRWKKRVFLVSARHAIAGEDAFTGRIMSQYGFLPSRIRVHPFLQGEAWGERAKDVVLAVRTAEGAPLWLDDPEFEELRTDIACVELADERASAIACVNDALDDPLPAHVGLDCFVIGYPNRNFHDPYFPVWRRGCFAYEPMFPIDDKPIFLVDAMTSKGMSGAAIFQRWHGPAPYVQADGEIVIMADRALSQRLIGVYGGRLDNKAEMAQIGYGWYANRIPHIIEGSRKPR